MYMPKLGITHRRSKVSSTFIVSCLGLLAGMALVVAAWTQTAAPQSNPPAPSQTAPAPPPANQPTTGQNQPASGQSQPAPAQSQPGQNQAAPGQAPAQNQAAPQQAPAQQDNGQGPSANDNGTFVFHAEAREVVLHATVIDEKNHLVLNLAKPDFTILENGQPQKINHFQLQDYPVAMGIVIDNSGSMREKRDEVNKAALNLVRSSNPDDQVFVVNFSDEYYLDQDFTSDIKKLQTALENIESRGGTALYDAIIASADHLLKSPLQRKVLFVVTDGEDDASQESLEQAVQRLQQENGPTVYAIGLLGDEKTRHAKRALELIAERTGGIPFFPPNLNEVDSISRSIAHDIRNQYTISYAPTTSKNVPGYRTIHVEAHARGYKRLNVRTRPGYFPGQEEATK